MTGSVIVAIVAVGITTITTIVLATAFILRSLSNNREFVYQKHIELMSEINKLKDWVSDNFVRKNTA